MLKILINAYACSPGMGSEPGMAWNWVSNLAKFCELHIITEGEFREKIEEVVPTLEQGKNMHFYYNPVSEEIRKMCWNQGDWRFYKYYREWQWKTYLMAKEICSSEHIDVLHQLNMIGFREPGYLWKLSKESDVPFVWGPIGGLKQFPLAYLQGAGLKMKLFNRLKNILNVWQLKHEKRVDEALKTARLLVSSIPDSYRAIKKYKGLESIVIPETGCFLSEDIPTDRFDEKELHVMWVGKFDFRKQLPLALRAIAIANNPNIVLDIYGGGSDEQIASAKRVADLLGITEKVVWHGNQPNDVVMNAMHKAQVFLFTSVSEDTSTVVLEAVSNRLPVLCFDACGMAAVIDDKVGRKVALSNPTQSATDFAKLLNDLEHDRNLLKQLSENCKQRQTELSWEEKAKTMVEWYDKVK
ncbi:glycosyltransferase, group 1 family protein [Leyella stercorea DSM 18206]|jgi:glycosyltransferase involved in cell wall biosynthesis|uniref:Glycosyltransferase, group 1 family protein n=1 Tax=Leyella stercorea DSM 18206 TaxID=1002367 RepID=G6AX21_9BACT|nr:glycosyltransferase [Leyella stercorea]EHJ40797.1 glycosyltransferase, group 1 family protein [Leyella stercorea DSM 18206]